MESARGLKFGKLEKFVDKLKTPISVDHVSYEGTILPRQRLKLGTTVNVIHDLANWAVGTMQKCGNFFKQD